MILENEYREYKALFDTYSLNYYVRVENSIFEYSNYDTKKNDRNCLIK